MTGDEQWKRGELTRMIGAKMVADEEEDDDPASTYMCELVSFKVPDAITQYELVHAHVVATLVMAGVAPDDEFVKSLLLQIAERTVTLPE